MSAAPIFRAVSICGRCLVSRETLAEALAAAELYTTRGYTLSHVERWECVETYPAAPAVPK